jgi:hypothetical protein
MVKDAERVSLIGFFSLKIGVFEWFVTDYAPTMHLVEGLPRITLWRNGKRGRLPIELSAISYFSSFVLISHRTPKMRPKNKSVEPCLIQRVDCAMEARVKSGDIMFGATMKEAMIARTPTITANHPTIRPTFVNMPYNPLFVKISG